MHAFGLHGAYPWFETVGPSLSELVRAVPDLVRGHRVVVTAIDSGPFRPTDDELNAGWSVAGDLARSPLVVDPKQLPAEGFDEWYVDTHWPLPFVPLVFINFGGFSLGAPRDVAAGDSTWDRKAAEAARDQIAEQQRQFWQQLARLAPRTYLGDGDRLICATRDVSLFERAAAWVRSV
jgi:hypothetical protein